MSFLHTKSTFLFGVLMWLFSRLFPRGSILHVAILLLAQNRRTQQDIQTKPRHQYLGTLCLSGGERLRSLYLNLVSQPPFCKSPWRIRNETIRPTRHPPYQSRTSCVATIGRVKGISPQIHYICRSPTGVTLVDVIKLKGTDPVSCLRIYRSSSSYKKQCGQS